MAKAKHGTRARYVGGCRCGRCAKANRDYQREYMAKRYVPVTQWGALNGGYRRADGSVRWENDRARPLV